MARHRQLGAAGRSPGGRTLIRAAMVLVLFSGMVAAVAQPCAASTVPPAKELFTQQRWPEIVALAQATPERSADLQYYYGMALAKLGRWRESAQVFRQGETQFPNDPRFPEELAGVAFKQKNYAAALSHLHRALAVDPHDSYALNFLGTAYLLEGNLEAALKFWNRIGNPQIAEIASEPTPKLHPVLLDNALAFAPASELRLPALLTSEARVSALGIFPNHRFELEAGQNGKFNVVFQNHERNGWGDSTLESLFLVFRGLPLQTIYPSYFNLGHNAVNIRSLLRWDAEKRRAWMEFSGPLRNSAKRRYSLNLDLRGENWDIRPSFTGPAPLLGSLNLRREAVGADFLSVESGRRTWSVGAEFSHRDFRSIIAGTALTPGLTARGYQLKQVAQINSTLLYMPEHRLTVKADASSQLGRLWSDPGEAFEKLQAGLHVDWLPRISGDDYEVSHQIRAGKTFGDLPFDELYMLGVQHDNDLWMRAHIGTRNGRKGSAPLGRNYFLSNWDLNKNLYHRAFVRVGLGPFVDTGKISDPVPGLGTTRWLWDVGAEAKLHLFGAGIAFIYGKDLRTGNNAYYLTMRP